MIRIPSLATLVVSLLACGKREPSTPPVEPAAVEPGPAAAAPVSEPVAPSTEDPAQPADEPDGSVEPDAEMFAVEVGVLECDRFIARYRRCIKEMIPEAAKATSRTALVLTIDAWQKAASTPAGAEGLATACTAATQANASTCGWETEPKRQPRLAEHAADERVVGPRRRHPDRRRRGGAR